MEYGNLIGLNDLELNISVFKVINKIYYFFFLHTINFSRSLPRVTLRDISDPIRYINSESAVHPVMSVYPSVHPSVCCSANYSHIFEAIFIKLTTHASYWSNSVFKSQPTDISYRCHTNYRAIFKNLS